MKKSRVYVDPSGAQVPAKYVKKYDKERDVIAYQIRDDWAAMRESMRKLKIKTLARIDKMRQLAADETGVTLGGVKGNLQFRSFDGKVTVSIESQHRTEFDERLTLAQQLIMSAVAELTSGTDSADLAEIAGRAFRPRKNGNLDMARVRELRSYNVKHPKWVQACEIIADCERDIGTRQYVRVQERLTVDARPENIVLDMACIPVEMEGA